ncbi:MAG: beta strand repeat-containing protein [Planctomycetales bacterium]
MSLRPWLSGFRARLNNSQKVRNGRNRSDRRVQLVQSLEERTLLTATALVIGTELTVLTDAAEDVSVQANATSGNAEVLINGVVLAAGSIIPAGSLTGLTIATGSGNNQIDLSGITGGVFSSLTSIDVDSGDGDDVIIGTTDLVSSLAGGDGNDTITGGSGAEVIRGGDGQDEIDGGDGNDDINAGDGEDSVLGGLGDDTIVGDDGDDTIFGGDGNDSIIANNGADSLFGEAGDDTLNGDGGFDSIDGGDGNDLVFAGADNDTVSGGLGNDTVLGQAGDDSIDGNEGDDSITGQAGKDSLNGGAGTDLVNGNSGDDSLFGGDGDDTLLGGSGNDASDGQGGSDRSLGHSGNDTLVGGEGADFLDGGTGDDLIDTQAVTISIADLLISPEGNFGQTTNANFIVTLSGVFLQPVTVQFATSSDGTNTGGTAVAGEDYVATTGTVTFQPGETTQTLSVPILGDDLDESDEETFFVTLSNQSTGTILDDVAEGRIVDDDSVANVGTIDIFLLIDDTSSFSSTGPTIQTAFGSIISQLQTNFPTADLAFGVGRFEAYTAISTNRPFILNQPLISDSTPMFQQAIDAALIRTAPGGGRGLEPVFESLFQVATGAGFDGNLDGDTVDDGAAGLFTTQTGATPTGDIPAYSTFTADPAGDPTGPILDPTAPVASATDGVGFRTGSRRIVLVATDGATLVHEDDGNLTYTGVNGSTVPASTFVNGISVTPGGNGAGIQATIDALIAEQVEVIGLGESGFFGGASPQQDLTGIATLTGALNNTTNPIENNITPGPSPDDIQPGEPLYFEIDSNDPTGLATTIVTAITGAVGNTTPPPPPPPAPPAPPVGPQEDTLIGGSGDDTLLAGDTDDSLNGNGGDDSILAGGGNDTVLGGSGRDTIDGEAGDDSLDGQGGADSVTGGDGDDEIVFEGDEDGDDTIFGGNGGDTVTVNTGVTDDTVAIAQDALGRVTVTEGTSTLVVDSSISTVNVNGQAGTDMITIGDLSSVPLSALTVDAGPGGDTIDATGLVSGSVRVQLRGGDGNDTITGGTSGDSLFGDAGDDLINGGAGNDSIQGGDGNDVINTQGGDDTADGGAGDDSVTGGLGNDSLIGGLDGDTLVGNEGDDTLRGGFGDDNLNGNAGNDSLDGSFGRDSISGGDGDDIADGGRDDDLINGQSGNDTLRGDHGDDTLNGQAGDDEIVGGDGNDRVSGGSGRDGIAGGDGDDTLNGNGGSDTLVGNDGNDSLAGGTSDDILIGDQGDDILDGDDGNDLGVTGEGADATLDLETIDESFVLSSFQLTKLDGI